MMTEAGKKTLQHAGGEKQEDLAMFGPQIKPDYLWSHFLDRKLKPG